MARLMLLPVRFFYLPRTRHSKTTTTRRGNVTYRTVRSRGPFWGPYRSPQLKQTQWRQKPATVQIAPAVLESGPMILEGARKIEAAANSAGGPQSKAAARGLVEAAIAHEQATKSGSIEQVAITSERLSKAAQAYEQGCAADGPQQWLEPAHKMAEAMKQSAQTMRRASLGRTGSARSSPTTQRKQRRTLGIIVAAVIVVAIIIAVVHGATHTSYGDGYQWGQDNTVGLLRKTAPSCTYTEMVSSGQIDDPNFFSSLNYPQGANEPNDNFARWQAGCQAGAQNVINSFNSN